MSSRKNSMSAAQKKNRSGKNKQTITVVESSNGSKKNGGANAVAAVNKLMREVDMSRPAESAGEALGKRLGSFAGKLLGRITGTGDYTADLPTGGTVIEDAQVPQFIKTENARETRIRHREFVGNVYASATAGQFTNKSYSLNPGNVDMFPWLAGIAQHYDQWEPHGAVVIFKTLTSTYAASQSLGTVVIASDYDVYDPAYTTKVEMANSEFAVSGNAAQNLMHPIECNANERMTKTFTVLSGPLSTVDNKRFFDLCNVQVASEGCLANQLLGELWVTYDFSFYKPQLPLNPSALGLAHTAFIAEESDEGQPFKGFVKFSPYATADLLIGVGTNYIRFNPRYVGYHFLVQVRFTKLGSTTGIGDQYQGISVVPMMWSLATNITSNYTLNLPLIWQAHITLEPTTDGMHVLSFSSSPDATTLTPGAGYAVFVSVDQVAPKALNASAWAPPP